MEMELLTTNNINTSDSRISFEDSAILEQEQPKSTSRPFINANTEETTLEEMKEKHITPVFLKDSECLISHSEFIEATMDVVSKVYHTDTILKPSIRVSHPLKGRIASAKNKPANELLENERTLYYERMAFIFEIPTIQDVIGNNTLSLTVGGVKSYSTDSRHSRKGSGELFKVFIGFQNKVCTNLCVFSDGLMKDIKVNSVGQLIGSIKVLIENYNANFHIDCMRRLNEFSLTEKQFCQIIGRCRLYNHLPREIQKDIPPIQFGDAQISALVKDYYKDENFSLDSSSHSITLWKLYNLLTGVNKSSYIDSFLERSVGAFEFTERLRWALEEKSSNWYLS